MLSYVLPEQPGRRLGRLIKVVRMAVGGLWVDSRLDIVTLRSGATLLTHGMDPLCCSVPGWHWLVGRAAGSLGGCGDVAEHPAEYDAVER